MTLNSVLWVSKRRTGNEVCLLAQFHPSQCIVYYACIYSEFWHFIRCWNSQPWIWPFECVCVAALIAVLFKGSAIYTLLLVWSIERMDGLFHSLYCSISHTNATEWIGENHKKERKREYVALRSLVLNGIVETHVKRRFWSHLNMCVSSSTSSSSFLRSSIQTNGKFYALSTTTGPFVFATCMRHHDISLHFIFARVILL